MPGIDVEVGIIEPSQSSEIHVTDESLKKEPMEEEEKPQNVPDSVSQEDVKDLAKDEVKDEKEAVVEKQTVDEISDLTKDVENDTVETNNVEEKEASVVEQTLDEKCDFAKDVEDDVEKDDVEKDDVDKDDVDKDDVEKDDVDKDDVDKDDVERDDVEKDDVEKDDVEKDDVEKDDVEKDDVDKDDVDKDDVDKDDVEKDDVDKDDVEMKSVEDAKETPVVEKTVDEKCGSVKRHEMDEDDKEALVERTVDDKRGLVKSVDNDDVEMDDAEDEKEASVEELDEKSGSDETINGSTESSSSKRANGSSSRSSRPTRRSTRIVQLTETGSTEEEEESDSSSDSTSDSSDLQISKRRKTSSPAPRTQGRRKSSPVNVSHKGRRSSIKDGNKCPNCLQFLNDPELKMFPGDPNDAVEECIMLTDPKLSLTDDIMDTDQDQPQHKVTHFAVYDKCHHLCPFDTGLLETNKELYFSGYVKPIYEEDSSIEGGIPTSMLGPITAWWIAGYDGGDDVLVGFSTAYADYYLMTPMESYAHFMNSIKEKVYISKLIIEFLAENQEAAYEDLINKIQITVPPHGISRYTEDVLLRHAQFVVDQVESYDSTADEDENLIMTTPCMRALVNLAGVSLGQRRAVRKREQPQIRTQVSSSVKNSHTKAATTPLVKNIFESFFQGQIKNVKNVQVRRKRCGICGVCQQPDCGQCKSCRQMAKFGGKGNRKQACENRKCPNMTTGENDDDDDDSDDVGDDHKEIMTASNSSHKSLSKTQKSKIKWIGSPTDDDTGRLYYKSVMINDEEVCCGDCVLFAPDDPTIPLYPGKVMYMWEEEETKEKVFHVLWFSRGSNTILGETSDPFEVFIIDECEDCELKSVLCKCEITYKKASDDWAKLGGKDDVTAKEDDDSKSYFYQKWYNAICARFEDPPDIYLQNSNSSSRLDFCPCCVRTGKLHMDETVIVGESCGDIYEKLYYSVLWNGVEYNVGDTVYLLPEAFNFNYRKRVKKTENTNVKGDDTDLYPELYRKNCYVKGSNTHIPDPFRIGYIREICSGSSSKLVNVKNIKIRVKKFYRPEDTHSTIASYAADFNMLYWSDEEAAVSLSKVVAKCYVVYGENLIDKKEFFSNGPHRFYFTQSYSAKTQAFEEPPYKAQLLGNPGKGKGSKGKSKTKKEETKPEEYPKILRPLRALDVFAGCGGLSEGFHQSEVCETLWAIEKDECAAQAFRLNNPKCTVFTDDCNTLLALVMDGKKVDALGQKLPQKGDIELMCGGPPCQGFSNMNRFNHRQYSLFKNSLIVSYLSYCDFYRPRFFLLENVRNFVSFKNCMVLKLTLRCLIKMGYQCTFGVLQAGNYGVPQTRRRAFILAAAPGEKLPQFPEPLHVFAPRTCQLSVVVDEKKYISNCQWIDHAPYRTVTVRDSMSDLPHIKNGDKNEEIVYSGDTISHFQRLVRGKIPQAILRDHICKEMNSLVEARIRHVPLGPGSDWRDLPNIPVRLADGTFTKKLQYNYRVKKGKHLNKYLGVCACATGKSCDPTDRQYNTLIPWCLPHTGDRHNNWAGLYGRLEWDGFFSTTVTNPEPMGKQGRVLHPEQHRVVSVRECARSQGFPDSYRFFGNILDRHRQVGNAVPPPLAAAIGREIKKCVHLKEQQVANEKQAKQEGVQIKKEPVGH